MKKFIAMLLALVMALSLVACGGGDNGQQSGGAPHSFFVHPRKTSYSALR